MLTIRVKRKLYSDKNKEKDSDYIAKKGIVSGLGLAGLGGASYLTNKYLVKNGYTGLNTYKAGLAGKILVPSGLALAGVSGYKLHKDKKKRKADENKA